MTIEFQLKGFNHDNVKSFGKVLKKYGLTYEKTTDNDTRIIKFDKDFSSSVKFITFCMQLSEKYVNRKLQHHDKYDMFKLDIAINNITEPYFAVFTLHAKKHKYKYINVNM